MIQIDLSGKNAIITGGTRGIGRSIAQTLAEAGADVALIYKSDEAAAQKARAEIAQSTGRRAEVYRADAGIEAEIEAAVEQALADFGTFQIAVHNAGHGYALGMPDIETHQWRETLAVNLDGAFFLTRALLRDGRALPPGSSVVFISSGRGHDPAAGLTPYGTAKAALNHFAAMMAQDVGARGVRVNVVSPGYTQLPHHKLPEEEVQAVLSYTALKRLGQPEDVARAVLFFASDLSAFITGQWIRVNGGAA